MSKVLPFWCSRCKLRFARVYEHPVRGMVCPVCLESFRTATDDPKPKRRQGRRAHRTPPKVTLAASVKLFTADHAGHPLGPGYPTGSPLRLDVFHEPSQMWRGESHRMAWERILRLDPCAYCGAVTSGTVDHIEPKTLPVRGLGGGYCWLNLTAACEGCNGSKARQSLLRFLEVRGRSRPIRAVVSRSVPTREAA